MTRAFIARLHGSAVFDPNGEQLGKVRDFVVILRHGGQPPRVVGLVVGPPTPVLLPSTTPAGFCSGAGGWLLQAASRAMAGTTRESLKAVGRMVFLRKLERII